MSLQLQAGKRYVRRDGTVTPPLIDDDGFLQDPEIGCSYTESITNALFYVSGEHPHDLIAEYVPTIITRLEAIQRMADEAAVKYTPHEESVLSELYHAVTNLICDVQEGRL